MEEQTISKIFKSVALNKEVMIMKPNVRYQQTEDQIKKVVIQLIDQEGLAAVTIRQITANPRINRTTFYRHYLDKPDLIEKYRQRILQRIRDVINQNIKDAEPTDPQSFYPIFENIIKLVASDWDFYRTWLGDYGDQETVRQIKELINQTISSKVSQSQSQQTLTPLIPIDFAKEFIINQLWGIFQTWFNQEHPFPPEKVINILFKTRYHSPFQLMGWKVTDES